MQAQNDDRSDDDVRAAKSGEMSKRRRQVESGRSIARDVRFQDRLQSSSAAVAAAFDVSSAMSWLCSASHSCAEARTEGIGQLVGAGRARRQAGAVSCLLAVSKAEIGASLRGAVPAFASHDVK